MTGENGETTMGWVLGDPQHKPYTGAELHALVKTFVRQYPNATPELRSFLVEQEGRGELAFAPYFRYCPKCRITREVVERTLVQSFYVYRLACTHYGI